MPRARKQTDVVRVGRVLAILLAVFVALLLPMLPDAALAQSDLTLTVTEVDLSHFPVASVVVQVGGPVALQEGKVTAGSTKVVVDGQRVDDIVLRPTQSQPLPTATLLLIDESGSMRQAVGAAKLAAREFIAAMRPGDVVGVYAFNEDFRMLSGFSGDKDALVRALDSLKPQKETALYDALPRSLDAIDRLEGVTSRNIVVLSDGGDTNSIQTLEQALAKARSAAVKIYTVGLKTKEFDSTPLVKLSEVTGGRYLETPRPAELGALYAGLAREIQNQYLVEFTLPESARGTGAGKLTVRADLNGKSAEGSRGFFYPDAPTESVSTPATKPSGGSGAPATSANVASPSPGLLSGLLAWRGSDYLVALLTALLLFLAVFVGATVLFPKRDVLAEYSDILENRRNLGPRPAAASEAHRPGEKLISRFMAARSYADPIQRRIEDAGWQMRTSEFMLFQLAGIVVASLVVGFLPIPFVLKIIVVLLVAVAPLVYIDRKSRKRREAFERQVPDVLTLMAGSLRAGQGFEQALQVVAAEGPNPTAHEFRRLLAQQRLGVPPEETLQVLASRMQSEAFDWVVMSTGIQREVGGNLAEVYTNIAEALRQREFLRREVKTLTAEGILSAGILVLLPIVVGGAIAVFNFDYLSLLWTTKIGLVMVGTAMTLMLIGILWIRRVIHFDV